MIKLVNKTGGDTWVHEARLDEYLAAGYQLAAPPQAPEPDPLPKKPAKKPARKTKKG